MRKRIKKRAVLYDGADFEVERVLPDAVILDGHMESCREWALVILD